MGGESFFAEVSGWLYVPVEGRTRSGWTSTPTRWSSSTAGPGRPRLAERVQPPRRDGRQDRVPPGADLPRGGIPRDPGPVPPRGRVGPPPRPMDAPVDVPAGHASRGPPPARRRLAAGPGAPAVALAGRRIGVLGLLSSLCRRLAAALRRRPSDRSGGRRSGSIAPAGPGLAVLFLLLTATPLLIWPEHSRSSLRLLLAACVPGALAIGVGGFSGRAGAGGRAWLLDGAGRPRRSASGRRDPAPRVRPPWSTDSSRSPTAGSRFRGITARSSTGTTCCSTPCRGCADTIRGGTRAWSIRARCCPARRRPSRSFWPLLGVWRLPDVYAAIVALVGAVFVPWCLFATVRILGGSRLAALLAGLLALAPSDVYFWWLMGHGTLPALVSAALAPLIVALAWRVFVRHDHRWPVVLLLAAALLVGVFWALVVLMVGPPLLLGAVLYWRRLRRRDLVLAGALGAGVLLIHAHWLVGLFGTHLGTPPPPGPQSLAGAGSSRTRCSRSSSTRTPRCCSSARRGRSCFRDRSARSTEVSCCGSWYRATLLRPPSCGSSWIASSCRSRSHSSRRRPGLLRGSCAPSAGPHCRTHTAPVAMGLLAVLCSTWTASGASTPDRSVAPPGRSISSPTRPESWWTGSGPRRRARGAGLGLGRPSGAGPARGRLQGVPSAAHRTAAASASTRTSSWSISTRWRSFSAPDLRGRLETLTCRHVVVGDQRSRRAGPRGRGAGSSSPAPPEPVLRIRRGHPSGLRDRRGGHGRFRLRPPRRPARRAGRPGDPQVPVGAGARQRSAAAPRAGRGPAETCASSGCGPEGSAPSASATRDCCPWHPVEMWARWRSAE